jgi:ketosteroid isomerase-like protein
MKQRLRKCLLLVALGCLSVRSVGVSQTISPDVEREINAQVWLPMLAASKSFDADGFLAVQSRDLVRVSVDTKEVYGLERYATEIRAGFRRAKERALKRTSEMRFLTRTHSGALAHETGIFKSEVVLASGERRTRYTRFEMILRKEAGRWKILVDKDTSQNGTITEEEYRAAAPLGAS